MPMRLLYAISDFLYLWVYHIIKYRKSLVRKNLFESFPKKDKKELRMIERGFFHWFCDYFVETIKLMSITKKEIRKRMIFEGMELINDEIAKGRSVTLYLGHYCNWEWLTSLPLNTAPPATAAQLYHPIENKNLDRLFLYIRGRFKSYSIEMKEAFKVLVDWQKQGKISITGYISDQAPGYSSMHYWPMFLNHDTPAYTGAERIARILNTPVFYLDIFRPMRGYYTANVIRICERPNEEPKFSITQKYYHLLECSIQRNPEYWLWSHNRWKRTREEFNNLYSESERRRILNKL